MCVSFLAPREGAESELEFLGLLVMENSLKQETKPVLQQLAAARIRSVMVTGKSPRLFLWPGWLLQGMQKRFTPPASPWSLPGLSPCYGRLEEPASPLSLQETTCRQLSWWPGLRV